VHKAFTPSNVTLHDIPSRPKTYSDGSEESNPIKHILTLTKLNKFLIRPLHDITQIKIKK